jgi:hypothetical protein
MRFALIVLRYVKERTSWHTGAVCVTAHACCRGFLIGNCTDLVSLKEAAIGCLLLGSFGRIKGDCTAPPTMAARACAGERLAGEDPSDGLIRGDATDEGAAGFIKGEGVADPKFDRTAGDEALGDALEVSSEDGMTADAATTLVIGDEGFDEDRNNDLIPVAQPSLVAPFSCILGRDGS